jgi:dihydrofolate reductase
MYRYELKDWRMLGRARTRVVYPTLDAVSTAKTQLECNFDPDSVRDMRASATSDLTVRGPNLAARFKAGLVDECHLFIYPVLVVGGKPPLPRDTRAELKLLDEQLRGLARAWR